ncbi:MAG: hypothetical protein U9R19_13200 [Bacteroidota bacterium]|nr:hypothetical protein [Bacteroidota bacterium]
MKYFTFSLLFVFCAFNANAQLSAENYYLDDNYETEIVGNFSQGNLTLDELSDLEDNEFYKKRRKKRRGRRGGPDNILKTNLTNLVFMSPTITYERKLSSDMSAGGSLIFTSYNFAGLGFKISGPKVYLDFKYFTGGEAPSKFYVGGFVFFSQYTLVDESSFWVDPVTYETSDATLEAKLMTYGVGAMIGFQIITDFGLVIDLYTGLGAGGNSLTIEVGDDNSFADLGMIAGVTGRGGVSVGWAF